MTNRAVPLSSISWRVLEGDCREQLATLEPGSAQTCVTSPPYWGQRNYDHAEQIGLEPTLTEYVAGLVSVCRDVRRVLAGDGTLWLNLGDTFSGGCNGKPGPQTDVKHRGRTRGWVPPQAAGGSGLAFKQLCGVPWRVAFALQEDGWYLRSDIIWSKPNPMPESVGDRPTKAHEYLFLLSKQPRYFYDADAIREQHAPATIADTRTPYSRPSNGNQCDTDSEPGHPVPLNPAGRNRRSVWEVATQPFVGAHFATFPPKLIEPCILAGSREGDTVLDPFSGAGTTGMVALRLGRSYVGVELNPEYAALSRRRIVDDSPLLNSYAEAA